MTDGENVLDFLALKVFMSQNFPTDSNPQVSLYRETPIDNN